jgi:hypothetical protein
MPTEETTERLLFPLRPLSTTSLRIKGKGITSYSGRDLTIVKSMLMIRDEPPVYHRVQLKINEE